MRLGTWHPANADRSTGQGTSLERTVGHSDIAIRFGTALMSHRMPAMHRLMEGAFASACLPRQHNPGRAQGVIERLTEMTSSSLIGMLEVHMQLGVEASHAVERLIDSLETMHDIVIAKTAGVLLHLSPTRNSADHPHFRDTSL